MSSSQTRDSCNLFGFDQLNVVGVLALRALADIGNRL